MACSCLWDCVQPFFEKYAISDFEYIVRYRIYIFIYTYIFYTYIEFVTIVSSAFQGLHCNENILVAFPKLPHANTTQSRRHATQGLHWSSVAGLWCRGTWACATLLPDHQVLHESWETWGPGYEIKMAIKIDTLHEKNQIMAMYGLCSSQKPTSFKWRWASPWGIANNLTEGFHPLSEWTGCYLVGRENGKNTLLTTLIFYSANHFQRSCGCLVWEGYQ